MIKINLLSPSDRLSARWEKINRIVISNFLILIIGQLILLLVFLVSIKYLDTKSGDLSKRLENMQVQAEVREVEEIKASINEYDRRLKSILVLQKNKTVFTGVLEDFSKIIPAGVKVNSIDIKPKSDEILGKTKRSNIEKSVNNEGKFDFSITGAVKNREDLLKFEDNIRNSEIFLDLIINLSNYDSENNNFRYSMMVYINP